MVIYLISGDGQRAGKSHLASFLAGDSNVWSIASGMRHELSREFPKYRWFDKTQAYKDHQLVPEYKRGYTIRDVLLEYGQEKSKHDATYWISRLVARFDQGQYGCMGSVIAIDDIRNMPELNYVKMKWQSKYDVKHIHVANLDAIKEPIFDNAELSQIADYVVRWTK